MSQPWVNHISCWASNPDAWIIRNGRYVLTRPDFCTCRLRSKP